MQPHQLSASTSEQMSAAFERHSFLLTVVHSGDVASGSIYVDIAGTVGVQDACERHFVIGILWRKT